MKDNITVIIIVSLLAIHFLAGIGWLIYKILGANPSEKKQD
ncbi:hypothetical protein CLV31_11321 [Algoriphagus aquaeductus]|uniref:Uncharacterized protein n=1 Tax=Algoriphagus aquaeductus TaxID=475299 RepID=A0A326RQK3_9BACT|nr:hypothetical protein [Algoriphagus aquaeductus]PZV79706.1 hypothetical protein CLV31_11321 [Algoriphagus aquaeductus]